MQIKPHELERHLKAKFAPIYLLSGDEPLQLEESLDLIRQHARTQGFEEKIRFDAGPKFDWEEFRSESRSLSLFAARKVLDVRLPTGKPGEKGAKILIEYTGDLSPDNVLIIAMPKLDPATKRSAWHRALDKVGVSIQFWPVDADRLPAWIRQRARRYNLQIKEDAARALGERVEGNLLAAAQELEKLSLLHTGGVVDLDAVMKAVGDSARYSVFDCVDAALAGDGARVVRIVDGLQEEGTEPTLVAWALSREIRTLEELATERRRGTDLGALFNQQRLWEKRKRQLSTALKRLSLEELRMLLKASARVDRIIKGAERGASWHELLYVATRLAGVLIRPA